MDKRIFFTRANPNLVTREMTAREILSNISSLCKLFLLQYAQNFPPYQMAIPEYSATVIQNEYIAKETRGLKLTVHDANFSFSAGQFLSLKIQEKIFRAYSIASSPSRLPELSLCVKILPDGTGSQYIDALSKGDEIIFRGPFGHFGSKQPQKKTLCIATGTGIAPMRAIFETQVNAPQKGKNIGLLFGVREEEYASYLEDFQKAEREHLSFSFTLCVSRPKSEGNFFTGRVTDFLLQQPKEFFTEKEVLLCGNPPMVKEVTQILLEKGVEKENIVAESF